MLCLLVGGARSGKSDLALTMAARPGAPVTFVATAEALDDEMAARAAAHRSQRPTDWPTVEQPIDLAGAIDAIAPGHSVVIDCLTLWVSNLVGAGWDDGEVMASAREVCQKAVQHHGKVVVVSNEVGSGIVPFDPAVRRYRDLLGRANTIFAPAADEAFLVVAGRVLPLREWAG